MTKQEATAETRRLHHGDRPPRPRPGGTRTSQADAGLNIDHYKELAQTAERGKFDLVFVADSPAGCGARRRPRGAAPLQPGRAFRAGDAVGGAVAGDEAYRLCGDGFHHLRGSVPPRPQIRLARLYQQGRAAWNVVTTGADVSKNFSIPAHPAHADRYERAEEFVDLVKGCGIPTRMTPSSATRRAGSISTPTRSISSTTRASSSRSAARSMSGARCRAIR